MRVHGACLYIGFGRFLGRFKLVLVAGWAVLDRVSRKVWILPDVWELSLGLYVENWVFGSCLKFVFLAFLKHCVNGPRGVHSLFLKFGNSLPSSVVPRWYGGQG